MACHFARGVWGGGGVSVCREMACQFGEACEWGDGATVGGYDGCGVGTFRTMCQWEDAATGAAHQWERVACRRWGKKDQLW